MTSPSPNSDAFSPSRVVARLAEERDIDLSKVKFKVRSSSDVVAVEMLYDGKRIGGMNAHKVRYPEEKDCPRDVTALAKRFPELVTGEWKRSDGEVWRYITALAVFKAFITDEEFRGYGLGKKMYKTLMVAWFKKVGPFLFMPYKCDGGSGTSTDAMRVWHSLSKEFPSSGDVVAVMKNPRVARSVQAARPIRLPTREIKALAKKLAQRIHQLGLPKAGRVIAQEYLPLTNVMGDEVEVEILLTGTPGRNRDPFSNEMLNGGFLKRRPEGPVMRVFVNPHLDPRSFEMRPRRIIENELYRILTHELTHAADVWSGKGSVGDLTKSKDDLKRHHHNHPAEVRALMRDVVTEVEPTVQEFMDVGMTFNMAVKEALKDSKWVDIEPYLTPRNKKTILKGVFTHMQDQGLSKTASRTAGGFRRTIDEIEDETGLEAKVEAGADSIKIELKRGAKMVGYFRASTVSLDSFQWKEAPTDCKEAWGQMGEPPVWIVRGAEWFDPDLRGKGFGKLLYKALFSYIASKKGVVGPNRCSGGNTSPDAQRVWKSLRSMYPKHGPMIDLRSRRIGSRTAARPIRLDRRAVNELVDGLKRGFGKLRQDKDEPLGTHRQPIARDSIAITDVLGNVKAVKVVVISKPSRSGEVWIAGGFGHMRKGGQPVIIIEANAKYPLKMFLEMKGQVRSDLFKTLMHELTHAADVGQTSYKTKPGDIPSEQEVDNRKYYNDPKEVRAYMRELYEELRPIIHKVMDTSLADDWGKSGAFNRMLGNTQTWKRIEPHLTPRNKKKILKGVITAFEDEGWTSPKRVASRFAGLLKPPPGLAFKLNAGAEYAVCSFLREKYPDERRWRKCDPLKGSDLAAVFDLTGRDLAGWSYLRRAKVSPAEFLARVRLEKPHLAKLQVTIDFGKMKGSAGGYYTEGKSRAFIYVSAVGKGPYLSPSEAPKERGVQKWVEAIEDTIEHELLHYTQALLSVLAGVEAGLPSAKIRNPNIVVPALEKMDAPTDAEYNEANVLHVLRDAEFYTRLKDEVRIFKRKRFADFEAWERARKLWVSGADKKTIKVLAGYDRFFFRVLKEHAPGKWRKAVKEFMSATEHMARKYQGKKNITFPSGGTPSHTYTGTDRGLRRMLDDPQRQLRTEVQAFQDRVEQGQAEYEAALVKREEQNRKKKEQGRPPRDLGQLDDRNPAIQFDAARKRWVGGLDRGELPPALGDEFIFPSSFFKALKEYAPAQYQPMVKAFLRATKANPRRVASRFADCNPRSLSHSWIDPKGKVHPVPLVHAAWAEEKIRSTPSMLRSFVKRYREYYPDELYEIDHPWSGFLIDHGWVRVANFLNFEGRDHLVSQHAWDSAVDLIIYCMAKNHQLDPETTVVTVAGYGKGRFSVSQIVREWGGRKAEDRLFGALRARTASGYAPDSKQEVENWVEDFGYENNYTPGTCDLNRGDCDMMSNVFADWFENQTGVGLQLWAGQGFIPPLGKDANDLWIELTGDQAHKRGEKPLSHVVAVWGKWVIDLTGRQFGSKYRAPVYPLSEFKKNWAATGKTNRANRGINNLRRMMLQHN